MRRERLGQQPVTLSVRVEAVGGEAVLAARAEAVVDPSIDFDVHRARG